MVAGRTGQHPTHCRPPALPPPFQVTPRGPSVFLPLPCPPLAELLSVQQPQFGKLSSRELGHREPAFTEPVAERLRARHSILSLQPGGSTPRGPGYFSSLVLHLSLGPAQGDG